MPAAVADGQDRRGGFGSLGSILGYLVLAWSALLASFPLNDNSFLTHLATGRIILDEGRVPTSDPYTFTASGESWTVQSWLASVAYATSERLAGQVGLRALVVVVFVIAGALLWRLTAPAPSVIGRLVLAAIGLVVATGLWSERPYMVGVIGIAVVWLALDGRVPAWVPIPLLWVWANAHGSFPLAIVLCFAVWTGSALDRRETAGVSKPAARERDVTVAVLLGAGLAAVGPLGPAVLTFPFKAFSRSEVFADIIEWQPPTYQSWAERAFLVLVAVTAMLLARRGTWRLALPAVGFAVGGLYAQRNVVLATMVLVAVSAQLLPPAGTLRSRDRPALGSALAVATGGLAVLASATALSAPVAGFGGYPLRALAFVEARGLEGRTATEMPAGNLLGLIDGPSSAVFVDDRVDMFPEEVFEDFLTLRRGRPGWDQVLDLYEIQLVVWDRAQPLASVLAASERWITVYSDAGWVVACRRSSCVDRPTTP